MNATTQRPAKLSLLVAPGLAVLCAACADSGPPAQAPEAGPTAPLAPTAAVATTAPAARAAWAQQLGLGEVPLTIHARLQADAEAILAAEGQRAAAVVVEPSTGRVLALASFPPSEPGLALEARHAPGSTLKPFVALVALGSDPVKALESHTCTGELARGPLHYGCSGVHGALDLGGALASGCNIYFFELGESLGNPSLFQAAQAFGFGEAAGLPRETPGALPSPSGAANPGDVLNSAIGQGQTASVAQVARAYAGLAARGELRRLRLQADSPASAPTAAAPAAQVALLEDGLRRAAVRRLGPRDGRWTVAGMSGAAQAVMTESGCLPRDSLWFAGYAPAETPRVALALLVEEATAGAAGRLASCLYDAAEQDLAGTGPGATPCTAALGERRRGLNSDGSPHLLPYGDLDRAGAALVLRYEDFGPPSMASRLLGSETYSFGPSGCFKPTDTFDVRVVVYRSPLDEARATELYPTLEGRSDYRLVELEDALAFLEEELRGLSKTTVEDFGPLLPVLRSALETTKRRLELAFPPR